LIVDAQRGSGDAGCEEQKEWRFRDAFSQKDRVFYVAGNMCVDMQRFIGKLGEIEEVERGVER
jgi:hypothetical protein